MSIQPDELWYSISTPEITKIENVCLHLSGFQNKYEQMLVSEGPNVLNTPEFEINNPLHLLAFDPNLYENDEMTNLKQNTSEQLACQPPVTTEYCENVINNWNVQPVVQLEENVTVMEVETASAPTKSSVVDDIQRTVNNIYRCKSPTMRVDTQPVQRQRLRYRKDGIRYLKGSRNKPMSIELPPLDGCLVNPDQSFWLELTLVTTNQNPQNKRFFHLHEMTYKDQNIEQNGLGSFRILLTDTDIASGKKIIQRLSVIKTKKADYTFNLVPFDPLMEDNNIEYYTVPDEENLSKAKKSKLFDETYHTNDYQIIAQLMIKQNDLWHMTPIYCETHVIFGE